MQLCFTSRNAHKVEEIQAMLGADFQILSLDDIHCLEELAETTDTIEGNSLQKAQYVWDNFQVNCFADDSGLEVMTLNGEPGVHSAYYAGSRDADQNIALVLQKLGDNRHRQAQFKTVITLIVEAKVHQFTGIIEGEILFEQRGNQGFGYDPIFLPKGYDKTFGEMSLAEKNPISHRGLALQQLVNFLRNNPS